MAQENKMPPLQYEELNISDQIPNTPQRNNVIIANVQSPRKEPRDKSMKCWKAVLIVVIVWMIILTAVVVYLLYDRVATGTPHQADQIPQDSPITTEPPPQPSSQSPVVRKIAFSAFRDSNFGPVSAHTVIPFIGVLLNDGNAYNIITSTFTAPVTGTYVFSVMIRGEGPFAANLNINNVWAREMVTATNTAGAPTVSTTYIRRLSHGDRVNVQLESHYGNRILVCGYSNCGFGGFLLYE